MKTTIRQRNEQGFTLLELIFAVLIAAIVMGGVFTLYRSQQRSYVIQDEVAAMQQNLRSALFFMAKEIRMAACDPTGKADEADFSVIQAGTISFAMDFRGQAEGSPPDGAADDPNESVTYSLYDGDGDGDADDLGRNTGGGNQLIAQNIQSLVFRYLDTNGNETAQISQIRRVEVTLIAKSEERYGTEKQKTITTTIKCRNKGLGI